MFAIVGLIGVVAGYSLGWLKGYEEAEQLENDYQGAIRNVEGHHRWVSKSRKGKAAQG